MASTTPLIYKRKIVNSKKVSLFFQPFFVERAFRIFDVDGNGTVSMSEFIDTMHKFAGQSSDEKLVFLFRVYDLDGKQSYTSQLL